MGSDQTAPPVLVDGVPSWMRGSLKDWLRSRLHIYDGRGGATKHLARVREFDQRTQQEHPLGDIFEVHGFNAVLHVLENSADQEDLYVHVLDYLVFAVSSEPQGQVALDALEVILARSGSKWKVGTRGGHFGLEDRVPAGVQDAADQAMARPGDAGRLLSEAWHATYGMNPQPDLGYRKSIEAVEAVVLPLVTGNDATAHLGKAIGQMRAEGDWKLSFIKEHKENPSQGVVLGMMQALWSGHSDRHPGTPNYVQSTQGAAEAAVSLAVTIVNLFSNGGIARRP